MQEKGTYPMTQDKFNGHMIVAEYLPVRARSKTKKETFTADTFEEAFQRVINELSRAKSIVRASTRQIEIEKGDGVTWYKYPGYCPTYRQLTEEEILTLNSKK